VRASVGDGFFPRGDFPLAPRRDDGQLRPEGLGGKLEAHLVIALARAAVGQGVRADFLGEFHLPLGQQRARKRSAQQIFMLVDRAGAERRPDVAGNKFLAQVFDVRGAGPGGQGFFARGFEVFALAQVADHGDHLAAIRLLQPGNDDGGIQPSGIGEDDFFRHFVLL